MPKTKLFVVPKEARDADEVPNNLPSHAIRLVGREKEVAAACRLLTQPDVRLLTVVGPGGVGKTSLALAAARELLGEPVGFEGGVYLVELASVTHAEMVIPMIATTLEVREGANEELVSTLQAHLVGKRMLLVLDNFEQVVSAGSDLADLLAACPDLKLLITSRSALRLRNEQVFSLSPLSMPKPSGQIGKGQKVQALLRYGAIALFVQRARTLGSEFELTEDNAEAVAEVCRRVDGLPLAIELVAAHARLLSPRSILARMSRPLRLLTAGPADAPERHQTMRDTIEWSYKLLDEEEQRLFRRVSVFVGGFAVRVAEAVCNRDGNISIEADDPAAIAVLEGLEALVDKNLVRRLEQKDGLDGNEDRRLAMLETVRAYAWEQLEASGEAAEMQRRHADYYLRLADTIKVSVDGGPDMKMWLDRLSLEQANLRAALVWLLDGVEGALLMTR
jgi:predicted ATPase